MDSNLTAFGASGERNQQPNNEESTEEEIKTYPPHDWGPRPAPTGEEIEYALETAHQWWWTAAFGGADDCLKSHLDTFDRYLGERVRNRDMYEQNKFTQKKVQA